MTQRRPHPRSSDGQTAAEYAVLLALLVTLVLGVLPLFGASVVGLFNAFAVAFGG
jgi:Flp pilus assembly pilin Flp